MDCDFDMEELVKKMIHDLLKQVLEKVPKEGSFPVVYERYENPDKRYNLTHIILKVTAVPVKGAEDERYLEIAAVRYPQAYGAESVVGFGTIEDIIKRLQDKELFDKILSTIPRLARDIEDTAWEVGRMRD